MFRTTAKIIKICLYGAVILIGVTFAVSNRGMVDLTFYPLPYVLSLPLFLFAIFIFVIGLFFGWTIARFAAGAHRRAHKRAEKRAAALENELGALRAEQAIRPVAPVAPALPPR